MKKYLAYAVGYMLSIIFTALLTIFLLKTFSSNTLEQTLQKPSEIKNEKTFVNVNFVVVENEQNTSENFKQDRKNLYLKEIKNRVSNIFVDQKAISKETLCLAKNIFFEAGGESFEDKILVANVTLNRVDSGEYPSTICATVFQDKQFSWTMNKQLKQKRIEESQAWEDSLKLASWTVANKESLVDFTNGALYYHAHYVRPQWSKSKKRTMETSAHIFYK